MYNYSCSITRRIWRGIDVSTAVYAVSRFSPKEKEEIKPWVMCWLARVSTAILGRKPIGPTLEIDYQILEFW